MSVSTTVPGTRHCIRQSSHPNDGQTEAQRGTSDSQESSGVPTVGGEATGSEALARAFLPYMLIPGMAGPRELGGGLMPLP